MQNILSSSSKVALNTSKELAERNLDVSPFKLEQQEASNQKVDHRSIAARVTASLATKTMAGGCPLRSFHRSPEPAGHRGMRTA